MTIEEILTATFVEHEHLAPDADALLADLQQQLARRRRRTITRSLTILSAAAVVAVLAIAVTLVHGTSAPHKATTGSTSPAGPNTTTTPPAAIGAAYFTTIAAGWLPGSMTEVLQQDSFGTQLLRYDMTGEGVHTVVNIELRPGNTLPRPPVRMGSADVTINGQPGRHFVVSGNRGYLVSFQTGDGHVVIVTVLSPQDRAVAEALHIARTLQLGRHDPIPTAFKLTHLPAGLTVRGVAHRTASEAGETTYWLAATNASPDATDSMTVSSDSIDGGTVSIGPAAAPGGPTRSAGRPVQGHPSVVQHNPGLGFDLEVGNFRPGIRVVLSAGAHVALVELYRTADGVEWNR
jgi:hypothetical protein